MADTTENIAGPVSAGLSEGAVNAQAEPTVASFDRHLRTDHLMVDLKGHAVRGGTVTVIAQAAKFILQTISAIVLSRLISPADFGLVAMVTAITAFMYSFNDLGLSMATIQRAEITHAQTSTLFWINVALGLAIAVITAGLAPAISWFYGEPRLLVITLVLASAFIFGGLSAQHIALLRRQMRFAALAVVDIGSTLIGFIAAVVLAFWGAGYWALVAYSMVATASGAGAAWLASEWRPGWWSRSAGVREMVAFGGNLTGFSIMNYFARNLDNVLIGRVWGSVALGYYARAYNLMMLPLLQINEPISAVALPCLSRLQEEPPRYRSAYLKFLTLIATITIPGVTFCLVMGYDLVLLVLGKQWAESARIFQVLALAALVQPVTRTNGLLFVSTGRAKLMMQTGVASTAAVIICFFVGLPYGAIGVAWSYAVVSWLLMVPILWIACSGTAVRFGGILASVWRPIVTAILITGLLILIRPFLGETNRVVRLGACAAVAGSTWLLAGTFLAGQVRPDRWIRSLL